MKTREPQLTPLMKAACLQAEAALAEAIKAVDRLLRERNETSLPHPELIVAFMAFAGSAHQVLCADAIIDDRFTPVREGAEMPAIH